ncbi:MAG: response regulator [Lachnospiraceae bacterium]|nr:response regulator [Lachnospiraceae bacterium]
MLDNKKTILVIDDDNASSYMCETFLSDQYQILSASTGREGVRMVHNGSVDLILLDIQMPVMDGFATFDEIRKTVKGVQTPVIFITGRGDKKTVLKCRSKGVEGFIVKPIKKEVLIEKVNNVFSYKDYIKSRKKVLVIDDDVDYLRIVRLYLQEKYEVMIINTTRTAIEYLRNNSPDIILVDYYMPLYSGGDILRIIKSGNLAAGAGIILMSGSMDRQILNECARIGLDGALAKTASKDEMLAKIEEVLEKAAWAGEEWSDLFD